MVEGPPEGGNLVLASHELPTDPHAQVALGNAPRGVLQGSEAAGEMAGENKTGAATDQNRYQQQWPDVVDEHLPQQVPLYFVFVTGGNGNQLDAVAIIQGDVATKELAVAILHHVVRVAAGESWQKDVGTGWKRAVEKVAIVLVYDKKVTQRPVGHIAHFQLEMFGIAVDGNTYHLVQQPLGRLFSPVAHGIPRQLLPVDHQIGGHNDQRSNQPEGEKDLEIEAGHFLS